jgi:RsiW-degrading membrane proteinase PrsW (M82 family)
VNAERSTDSVAASLRTAALPDRPPTEWSPTPPAVPDWAADGPIPVPAPRRLPLWLPGAVLVLGPFVIAEPLAQGLLFPQVALLAGFILYLVSLTLRWASAGTTLRRGTAVAATAWGGTVAIGLAVAVAAVALGDDVDSYATQLAPFAEEVAKATVLAWALWRARVITTPFDGLIVAAWCGAGFAAVENVGYFYDAQLSDQLAVVAAIRGGLSPFAHLLFAAPAGVAAGYAASRCWGRWRSIAAMAAGVAVGTLLHSAWNSALWVGSGDEAAASRWWLVAVAVGFFVLFCAGVVAVAVTRDIERARLDDACAAHGVANVRAWRRAAVLAAADVDDGDQRRRMSWLIDATRAAVAAGTASPRRDTFWNRPLRLRRRRQAAVASAAAPTSAASGPA